MRYKKLDPFIGDVLKINDNISLRFEKISADLSPVWMETEGESDTHIYQEGDFICVTNDCWFAFIGGEWKMMSKKEQNEAERQLWLDSNS